MGISQALSTNFNAPKRRHDISNLPQDLIDKARTQNAVPFNTKTHLAFGTPSKIHTLTDLALPEDCGVSPVAVTEPFQLFTKDAICQMRAEIFNEKTLREHYCPTSPTSGQVRGHCPNTTPFIYTAWTSPSLLRTISTFAGIDLVPAMDYDIGHVNISFGDGQAEKIVAPGEQSQESEFCESAFGWHRDSYPFVVVTMLSECEGMEGGETWIRGGDGRVLKARGPGMGSAVLMQGAYLPHQATAARGGHERISMVTSFRPANPLIKDDTIMRGTRNISHLPTLYYQYASYRLENLEARVRNELKKVQKRREIDGGFDVLQVREFLEEQKGYLDDMLRELKI